MGADRFIEIDDDETIRYLVSYLKQNQDDFLIYDADFDRDFLEEDKLEETIKNFYMSLL